MSKNVFYIYEQSLLYDLKCGWPNLTSTEAPRHLQYPKRETPFYDNFSKGFTNKSWNIALAKGCCEYDDENDSKVKMLARINLLVMFTMLKLLYFVLSVVNTNNSEFIWSFDLQHPYYRNLNLVEDDVNGVKKNVLALTAWNEDDATTCPGPSCVKNVRSSGTISTADLFASGKAVSTST